MPAVVQPFAEENAPEGTSYRCLGLRPDGVTDWRDVMAGSIDEAAALLLQDGWMPLYVRVRGRSLLERLNEPLSWRSSLSGADRALLAERLAILLEAGVPLDRSLELLRHGVRTASLQALLVRVADHVRQGGTLAQALRREARDFPGFFTGVVEAAERSGRLAPALRTLGANLRQMEEMRQRMTTALLYPAIVLLSAVAALLIVLTGVLPQFEPLFAGEESGLPVLTRVMLSLSRFVTHHGWLLIASGGLFGFGLWHALRRRHPILDRLANRLPGHQLRMDYLAGRYCRILGLLIANGVSILEALELTRGALGSARWRQFLECTIQHLREGTPVAQAFGRETLLPATALRLVEVGAASGQLGPMVLKAAELLELETKTRMERLVTVLPPIAIVALGGLVALMILSVMLGIFSMNEMVLR